MTATSNTLAEEVAPGLFRLTRARTGVQLWLAVRRGEARFSYCEQDARSWYAEAPLPRVDVRSV